jgi:outer membrane protein insertion porin family
MAPSGFVTRNNPLILRVCVAACLAFLSLRAVEAQQPTNARATQSFIERLEITGNRRIQTATIMDHIRSRPGDPYDGEAVQRDAQALRDTGYFDEVRLRVEAIPDEPNGKVIAFDLNEKPIIRRIAYRGIRSISETDLLGAYKNNKINLSVETWFDPEKLTRAATVIEELLASHGHPSATVKPSYEIVASSNVVTILFTVDEGPKAKSSPHSH